MRIPKGINNEDLEKLYENSVGDAVNLPSNFKNLRLGMIPRLCQYFVTLLKQKPETEVKFYQLDISNKEAVRNMLKDPQCLTAILLAEKVYSKNSKEDGVNNSVELKSRINLDIQERLNSSVFIENHRMQLFAVDHSIARYGYPSCFYVPEGSSNLRQSSYYSALLKNFLNDRVKMASLSISELDSFGELIYELVENTEQHGTIDFRTGRAARSVRGLVIDYKQVTKTQDLEKIAGNNTIVSDYLNGLRGSDKTLHMLEISLFDSGAGIASTLSDSNSEFSNADIQCEAKLIANSFAKGVTSKLSGQGFGRGLHNVRSILSQRNGLISVRSGRVSLYRNFQIHPMTEKDSEGLTLFDENTKSASNFKALSEVQGLACSILVPVL